MVVITGIGFPGRQSLIAAAMVAGVVWGGREFWRGGFEIIDAPWIIPSPMTPVTRVIKNVYASSPYRTGAGRY
jgi:hypothetical protein